jgi:hypothetical protein
MQETEMQLEAGNETGLDNADNENNTDGPKGFFDKLFGGIRMTWLKVIIFAIVTGTLTAAIAIWVPDGNSIHNIAVYPEAWALFAMLIIMNCEKPLEAGLKVFAFFLISQPLVYLLQVPFYEGGWSIFNYYGYWFKITLLTFPGGVLAWFVKRKDIIAALILSVLLVLLVLMGAGYFKTMLDKFPYQLLAVLFCFGQVILYITSLLRGKWARLIATLITLGALAFAGIKQARSGQDAMFTEGFKLSLYSYEADSSWSAEMEDPEFGSVRLYEDGSETILSVTFIHEGSSTILLTDSTGKVHHIKVSVDNDYHSSYTKVD